MKKPSKAARSTKPNVSPWKIATIILLLIVVAGAVYSLKKTPANTAAPQQESTMEADYSELNSRITSVKQDENNAISYTFERPKVGDYCNGCYDGVGGLPEGNNISTMTGGYDSPTSDRGWLLTTAELKPDFSSNSTLWGILPGSFFEDLKQIPVGETKQLKDENGKTYSFNRLPDVDLDGKTGMVYTTNLSSSTGTLKTEFVIFENKGKNVYISFEYADGKYAGVFQKIIDTFKWQ